MQLSQGKNLTNKEAWKIQARWLATFDKRRPTESEFFWHTFSFGRTPHVTDIEAIQMLAGAKASQYYVFGENMKPCLLFENGELPAHDDIPVDHYITDESVTWTFARTHEGDYYFSTG